MRGGSYFAAGPGEPDVTDRWRLAPDSSLPGVAGRTPACFSSSHSPLCLISNVTKLNRTLIFC